MATATAVAQPAWIDELTNRLAESLDRLCVLGIAVGLALWLPAGYGVGWLGDHFERPFIEALGSLCKYLGLVTVALLVLRWLGYMLSPRTATLLDREVGAYFFSPIAYLVLIGMLVINLINFWQLVTELHQIRVELVGEASPVISFISYNLWFWLGMLFVIPVITMRLLAEEKRSGTIEVLMTAPVTELQVVMAKFVASLLFYCLVIVPSALFLVVLREAGNFEFELLPVVGVYLGTLTVGAMFLSVGLFFSSLTRNQIVAAMLTFAVLMILFSTFVLDWFAARIGTGWAEVVKYIAVLRHLGELGKGRMDLKFLLFHLSVVVFTLFVTVKVVEARKWR
jgi:ABC-2 type transport system permease protein